MDLNRASNDPEFASAVCDLLLDLKQSRPDPIRVANVEAFLNGRVSSNGATINGVTPTYECWVSESAAFIAITGASTAASINGIVASYQQARIFRQPDGFTPAATRAASNIMLTFQSLSPRIPRRIIIGGYSWGGAVALNLAKLFRSLDALPVISVCTFGSPKPGDDRLGLAILGIDVTRYMNVGDYVCLFPPEAGNANIMYNLLPASAYHNLLENQQVGRGVLIDTDFSWSDAVVPPAPSAFTELSLAGFLVSNEAPVSQFHALETYAHRLDNAPRPAAGAAAAGGAANNVETRVSPRNGPASPRRGVPVAPPAPIVDVVRPPQAFNGDPNPYYSTRANGVPVVQYLGVTIAVCKGTKAARNLARSLNTSWRRWNNTRVADAAALSASVTELFLD